MCNKLDVNNSAFHDIAKALAARWLVGEPLWWDEDHYSSVDVDDVAEFIASFACESGIKVEYTECRQKDKTIQVEEGV